MDLDIDIYHFIYAVFDTPAFLKLMKRLLLMLKLLILMLKLSLMLLLMMLKLLMMKLKLLRCWFRGGYC